MMSKNTLDKHYYANLKLHLKALDVGLWDYDISADALSCDARWYDLLGLKSGSVRCIADFRPFIHPDDVEHATSADPEEVATMIALDQRYHVDFRVIMPSGQLKWIRSVACLLNDAQTGHLRAVGCITDHTEFRLIDPSFARDDHEPHDHAPDTHRSLTDEDRDGALSSRELECLSWVSVGKTAWETAMIMGRSRRTVEFHLINAVRKLSASNKIHAAVIAIRKGLI